MRNRIITYAIDSETGLVISRIGSEYAWPVLDYEAIGKDGDFSKDVEFFLEKIPVGEVPASVYWGLKWTKKIPVEIKNYHRAFWGMPLLKVE